MIRSAVLTRLAATVTLSGLLIAPQLSLAAAPFGERDLSMPITPDTAYRLPGVFATDLKFQTTGEIIQGSFTAWNNEDNVIGGLQFKLQILSQEGLLIAQLPVREAFGLDANEKRLMHFTMPIPAIPAGQYVLRVQMVTTNGRALGWNDMPLTVQTNVDAFVTLTPLSLDLPEFPGQFLEPMTGPNVSPSTAFALKASVKSTSNVTMNVTPVLHVHEFDIATGEGKEVRGTTLTLNAGETKPLQFTVTAAQKAGVYAGVLQLVNDKGATVSSLGEFRWVVRGESADTLPIRITHLATLKGDQTEMKLDFVGAPDAETKTENATLTVQLSDEKGLLTETSAASVFLSDMISQSNVRLTLPRDVSGTQTLRVTIANEKGTVLSDQSIALPTSTQQSSIFAVFSSNFMVFFTLLALAIAGAAFALGKYGKLSARTLSIAAMAFIASITVMGATKTLALGNGNGIEILTPRIVNAHTGPVYWVTIFVNAPIHNAPAGTYVKNAVPLQYNLTWGVCQNRVTTVRVVGRIDLAGGKQTTLEGTNANWQNVYSKTVESGVCPVGTPAAPDGAIQCFQYQNFSEILDLSALPIGICSTTLQMVAKSGVSGPGLPADVAPPPTDDSLLRTDKSISTGFAHGVNLWLNFCGGVDLIVTKTASTASVLPGGTISYALTVKNNGSKTAHGVLVADQVRRIVKNNQQTGEMLEWDKPASSPECTAGYVNQTGFDGFKWDAYGCTVGDLEAGQSKTFNLLFKVPNTPAGQACTTGNIHDVASTVAWEESGTEGANPANNVSTLTTSLDCTATSSSSSSSSFSSSSSSSSSSVSSAPTIGCIDIYKETFDQYNNRIMPVPQFTFRLDNGQVAQNDANGNAKFVNVPVGTRMVSEDNASGWTQALVTPANGSVNVIGGSTCVSVNFKNRQNTFGSSSSSSADFSISKSDGQSYAELGEELEYTITVRNNSNVTINNMTITDRVPDELDMDTIDIRDGGRESGRNVRWENITLGAYEQRTFRFSIEVSEDDAEDGDTIRNTVTADANGIQRTADDTTRIEDEGSDDEDLTVNKEVSSTEVFPGGMVEYTIRVRNDSNRSLTNVRVTDIFPSNAFDSISNIRPSADSRSNSQMVWKLGTLEDGESVTIRYTADIDHSAYPGQTITNNVEVKSGNITVSDSARVSVIGNLPQTGGNTPGNGGSQFLRPISSAGTESGMPTALWVALALTGIGTGGFFGRRFFI